MRTSVCRSLTRVLAGLAIAIAVAACGSAATTSSPPAASTQSTTTVTRTESTPSTSATTTTTGTTSTASGPAPCRAADLALSFLGGQGATGHGELGFALRNTSQASCSTVGYPGVEFLDSSGTALPTAPTHTTSDFFGQLPLRPLVVSPGQTVSFRLGVTHGSGSTSGCATAAALQVIAPNDTATLRVSLTDGAYECRTVTVSPMQPGISAYH